MSTYPRRVPVAALSLIALVLTACDTGTSPVARANVQITAYIDVNSSLGNDAGDEPVVGATITLTLVGAGSGLTATTDAMGEATFVAVEVGSYTASIQLPGSVTGVTLASASSPTVVAEENLTAAAEFRYTYNPGSIDGHVFLGSGSYTAGDLVVPDVDVTISQGGTEINTVTTDETGAFSAGGLLPGDYDVEVTVPPYLTTTAASQTVAVTADQAATADFGMDPNATHTVAEARAAAPDDTVSIIGVAITSNVLGTDAALSGSSFFMQDASGISIFLAGVTASVELGDSVLVYGVRGSFSNEVQLSSLAVLVLGQGTLPTPTTATAADLNGDMYQGQLVTIQDVIVDSIPGSSNSSGEIWVSEFATGEDLALYIDSDAGFDIGATFTVGNAYDVTGVMSRYFDLFELKPRMPADVADEDLSGMMSIADARAAATGTPVTVTGVVTEPGTLEGNGFYMEDATAGIFVYTGSAPAGLTIGDVVTVEGDRDQYFNIAQIGGTVTVTPVRTASTPVPTLVTIPGMNSGDVQGQLVQLTEVVLDSVGTASGSGVTLYVTNATNDTAEVRLDVDSNLTAGGFTVGETYTFVGVVSNFNVEQLKPRFPEDAAGFMPVDTLRTVADARAAELGSPVELTGVVTVPNGPSGTAIDDQNAYMQDGTAGILIRFAVADSMVAVGDSVTVIGSTSSFFDELQVNVDSLIRLGAGTVPTPRSVTAADMEAGLYQGELAVLDSVEVTAVSGGTITVQDGTGTTTVYVDGDTEIDAAATFIVGNSYQVTGVLSRYFATFELKPRDNADIVGL